MENAFNRLTSRLDMANERISKLQDRTNMFPGSVSSDDLQVITPQ